jgi:hypothetical protein
MGFARRMAAKIEPTKPYYSILPGLVPGIHGATSQPANGLQNFLNVFIW